MSDSQTRFQIRFASRRTRRRMNPPFEAFAYDARDAIDERDAAAVRRRVDGSARAKTWTSDDEDADDDARSSASEPSDDDDDDDDDDDASDASETSDESLSSLDGDDVAGDVRGRPRRATARAAI